MTTWINDGIIKQLNGKFRVVVQIQDGVEWCGEFSSEEEARKDWKKQHKAYNGVDRKKKEAKLYKEQKVETVEIVAC